MKNDQILTLNQLNKDFYLQIEQDFSRTRQQPWEGWFKLKPYLEKSSGKVLDVGCGNGRFGQFLQSENLTFTYQGIDSNQRLLDEAKQKNPNATFLNQDLILHLLEKRFLPSANIAVCFGVLHHIPSSELRQQLFKRLTNCLPQDGLLMMSTWQFLDIPKLILDQNLPFPLEENDYLLSWGGRSDLRRYCHLTTDQEIQELTENLPLQLISQFAADGHNHHTNHYFIWRKTSAGNL